MANNGTAPSGENVAFERANRALRSRTISELAASAAELTKLAANQQPALLSLSPEGGHQVELSRKLLVVADALAIEDARRNPLFRDRMHTETVVGAEIAAALVLPISVPAEEQRAVRAVLKDAALLTNEKQRNNLVTMIAQDCPYEGLKRQAKGLLQEWGVPLPVVIEAPVPVFQRREQPKPRRRSRDVKPGRSFSAETELMDPETRRRRQEIFMRMIFGS